MAVPFGSLIPQRSRVLPQGGAVLGQLTGRLQQGLEEGRLRAAEDDAPNVLMNYLDTLGAGYGQQPTLGNLTGGVAPQPAAPVPFDGRPTRANAERQAAAGGVDVGVQLLNQFEGFRSTPYEDWSYRPGTGERYMSGMRIGYGQTIPGATNITEEQAQAALRQQIQQQYIPSIVGTVGADTWGRLNPDQQGVLISLAHNYGSIPGRIVPALQSGDSAAAAAAIAALGGDNSGINQRRREQEAMAFAGTGAPVSSPPVGGAQPSAGGGGYAPQQLAWSPPTGAERQALYAMIVNPFTREQGMQLAQQRMTPPAPAQPNWTTQEFNGTLYRVDVNSGRVEPLIQGQPSAADRPTAEDQNGVLRYRDTGEPVFPNVQEAPPTPDFGFVNVPGVGLMRTNDVAGTAETIMPAPPAGANFENEESLRDNFRTETSDYRLVQGHYERLQAAAANPSAAGDIAMVYGFMKMLDPASVVRETEYATAQNAAGVDERVRNIWNQVLTGERLSPEQRADFLAQAGAVFGATQQQFDATQQRFVSIAQQYGIDPARIFGDTVSTGAPTPTPPPSVPPGAPAAVDAQGNWVYFNGTAWVAAP